MMIYLRPSFQVTYVGIVWCILVTHIDVTGAAGPKLNVGEEWVLLSSEDNITPLNITCTGDKILEWEWGSKVEDNTGEEYYKIQNNDVPTGFSSTFIIDDPFPLETGHFTCKYSETGESVTTYVYVYDNKTNFVNGNTYKSLKLTIGEPIVLDCRTTLPNITIKVYRNPNEDVTDQFKIYRHNVFSKVAVSSKESERYFCKGSNFADGPSWLVTINPKVALPKPMIQEYYNAHYVVGKDFSLNCSLHSNHIENIKLIWKYPNKHTKMQYKHELNDDYMVKTLIIKNPTLKDIGNYTCVAVRESEEEIHVKHIVIKEILNSFVEIDSKKLKMAPVEEHDTFQWILEFRAYPENITYQFFNPSGTLLTNEMERVSTTFNYHLGMISLKIRDVGPKDFGNYTIVMSNINGDSDSTSVIAIVNATPIVEFDEIPETYPAGSSVTLTASILSFDNKNSSSVSWYFTDNCPSGMNSCVEFQQEDELQNNVATQMGTGISNSIQSAVTFSPKKSGKVRCKIQNYYGSNYTDSIIYVSDIGGTFVFKVSTQDNKLIAPKNSRVTLVEGDKFNIMCAALDFSHRNVYLNSTSDITEFPPCNRSTLSSGICIDNSVVTLNMNGSYQCVAESKLNGEISSKALNIEVLPLAAPELLNGSSLTSSFGGVLKVKELKPFNISCYVKGSPAPKITWSKDGINIEEIEFFKNSFAEKTVFLKENKQVLEFKFAQKEFSGYYSCKVENRVDTIYPDLLVEVETDFDVATYVGTAICLVIVIALLCFIFHLVMKVKKEKRLREEYRQNRMYFFENGNVVNLNPDCTVDEQADLLPYDPSYEVERDRIKFGKLLGSGAFGRVMEAKVSDLEAHEKYTRVAVKMCKDESDLTQLHALTLELKIMIHLGKHLNIVNLMGAMTVNLDKGELWILVEYCRYGNMLRFLQKNRSRFVNQIDPDTGTIDSRAISPLPLDPKSPTSIGRSSYSSKRSLKDSVVASPTSNNSFTHYVTAAQFIQPTIPTSPNHIRCDSTLSSDESYHKTLATDMTVITSPAPCTAASEGDAFSFDTEDTEWIPGISGPITTSDLICWSWQVANGMEYLASRKVLHGDLAARNLLLAENNVVKISDFGLSRDMYKNDIYMKKTDGNMPIKWMSPEAIQQKIFSTQSDVWAFGITMWEIFTLGNTPYPGIPLDPNFTLRLEDGKRMDIPKFANIELYDIMLHCWKANPTERPSFSSLADMLAGMLCKENKEDYVAMNTVYMDKNEKWLASREDYFNLMSSPNFQNFQPDETQLDNSYLEMQSLLPQRSQNSAHNEEKVDVNEKNIFNFSSEEVSHFSDQVSPMETSKLLGKVNEEPQGENQNSDIEMSKLLKDSFDPTTQMQLATNNNADKTSPVEYKNIESVVPSTYSNLLSVAFSKANTYVSPMETSKHLNKVNEEPQGEKQNSDIEMSQLLKDSFDPPTPTSMQLATNNNADKTAPVEYKNIESVVLSTYANLSSVDSSKANTNDCESTDEINGDKLDACYVNVKDIVSPIKTGNGLATSPAEV